ncbi:GNAT family N-acetyltransferase [Bernardetia sp.]|uniref:GNAT family N-acetyltransferase n=1 Tax=Bernardetia sp. TaxID=1937974 RepID=UPI0025BA6020|nr:GNAT family N-acetyltransferase [Bernardetia sp.]
MQTERLYLREFKLQDAGDLYSLNNDFEVIRYTGDSPFENVKEAEEFVQSYDHYQKYSFGRWAVLDKKTNSFLGWCGLKYSPNLNEHDIGFRFFKKHWNKGYATEAAKFCIKLGFEKYNLETIVGRAMKQNQASIKVLEKLGMTFKKDFTFDNQKGVIYQITNHSI